MVVLISNPIFESWKVSVYENKENMRIVDGFRNFMTEVRKWTWHHVVVFFMTFFAYAFFHGCRKSISNSKNLFIETFTANTSYFPRDTWQKNKLFHSKEEALFFLGELDTIFLFSYAFGLFVIGILGNQLNLRYFLAFGMCSSAAVTFTFGYVGTVFDIQRKWFYSVLQVLNGLFQSIGWPATVSIMGNWFGKSSSGLVFGFWSGNSYIGNILGSMIFAEVVSYGYEFGMLINSFILFCGGIVILVCVAVDPEEMGEENREKNVKNISPPQSPPPQNICDDIRASTKNICTEVHEERKVSSNIVVTPPKAVWFLEAVSLAYACLKLLNYGFFFWLPIYLTLGHHWEEDLSELQIVDFSNLYDTGGIVGSIFIGLAIDVTGVRSPLISLALLTSVGTMLMFYFLSGGHGITMFILIMNGFFIGGTANIISTVIAVDLGKDENFGSGKTLLTVTGIIDGTGSVGAAIGQYIIAVIKNNMGWKSVIYFLILMTFVSFLFVIPMLVSELAYLRNRRRVYTSTT